MSETYDLHGRIYELLLQRTCLSFEVSELLPWALYGAITASQYPDDVIGSTVTVNGKVFPIFKEAAEDIKERIERGSFSG
jgi:hypothetical protein